jgi:hypothetical protein
MPKDFHLPQAARVVMALTREHGGVKPAKTLARRKLIQQAIEENWIEDRLINGVHPLTLRGFKIYVTAEMGAARYGFSEMTKLRRHNDKLASQISFTKASLDIHPTQRDEMYRWAFANDVCFRGFTSVMDIESYSAAALKMGAMATKTSFEVNQDDYPLFALKWCGQ